MDMLHDYFVKEISVFYKNILLYISLLTCNLYCDYVKSNIQFILDMHQTVLILIIFKEQKPKKKEKHFS